ncbi:MAG: DUF1501 domain-containing protein, partial [Bacteroidota bacterium]
PMCDHHTTHRPRAIALEDGHAHDDDHRTWTRRDFLVRSGLAATAGGLLLGGTPVRTLAQTPFLQHLAQLETDRVLVLIQLNGGNDGLNTIVPVTNDLYYNARPSLAIDPADTIRLSDDLGLNAELGALEGLWGEGRMAVVQGVGYPDHNLSHFRSTDIVATADTTSGTTGWVGRGLIGDYPDYETNRPPAPPAVQIGASVPVMFQTESTNLAMTFANAQAVERLASGAAAYDPEAVPATRYGEELAFVRTLANASVFYREIIQEAYAAGESASTPDYGPLYEMPKSLAATARLIKGKLGARVYLVSLDGFDTHARQANTHTFLMRALGQAIEAFMADLRASGDSERVVVMTFSEFGRRLAENGSGGTDHGTAAPTLVVGDAVQGGLYGEAPDLATLDDKGNPANTTDFRALYATLLERWLGLDPDATASVLGGTYTALGFLDAGAAPPPTPPPNTPGEETPTPRYVAAHPNPFRQRTQLGFTLPEAADVDVALYDTAGRRLRTLMRGPLDAGAHPMTLDGTRLPAGIYFVRLVAFTQPLRTEYTWTVTRV